MNINPNVCGLCSVLPEPVVSSIFDFPTQGDNEYAIYHDGSSFKRGVDQVLEMMYKKSKEYFDLVYNRISLLRYKHGWLVNGVSPSSVIVSTGVVTTAQDPQCNQDFAEMLVHESVHVELWANNRQYTGEWAERQCVTRSVYFRKSVIPSYDINRGMQYVESVMKTKWWIPR